MTMKATKRLIDSVWTLEYEFVPGGGVKILNYNREDPEGYEKEHDLPQCRIIEDEKRNITDVLIRNQYKPFDGVTKDNCDWDLKVVNPRYIFDYKS
jgi:hypothetical protein